MLLAIAACGAAVGAGEWNIAKTGFVVVLGVAGWGVYAFVMRPRVIATATFVEVVNPIRRYLLGWVDVVDVRASDRIEFVVRNGRTIRAAGTADTIYERMAGSARLRRAHEGLEVMRAAAMGTPVRKDGLALEWSHAARRSRVLVGVVAFVVYVVSIVVLSRFR